MAERGTTGGARAVERCRTLGRAPYSDMEGGLFRAWLSSSFVAAQKAVAGWMADAGMDVATDPATNLIGRYEGTQDGPALMIGSHLDSVRDGGFYDGPLGIMLGIEAVAALKAQDRRLPFPIEIIAFGDEEGSRFPAAMLTSRAVAGTLEDYSLEMTDAEGVTLRQALQGFPADTALDAARHAPALAYLEAHIEQGPVLEAEGLALGVVTGIAAQLRYRLTVSGKAGHAGTTSMSLRNDALASAAEIILLVERTARAGAEDLVATVGFIDAKPGAANIIPGRVDMTLDVRALDPSVRDGAASVILDGAQTIAQRRDVRLTAEQIHDLPASPCDAGLADTLATVLEQQGHSPRRLASGAGHDAMVMEALCPTAMVFIRCRGGVSHNPQEHVEIQDAEAALQAILGFLDKLEVTHDA